MSRRSKEIKSKPNGSREVIPKMNSKEETDNQKKKTSRGSITSHTAPDGNADTTATKKSESTSSVSPKQVPVIERKPSVSKSFTIEELPPCKFHRTRTSLDGIANPIEFPRLPSRYQPPFRRNFRYFGYPQDLNLNTTTPPRVRSWGPIEEPVLKSEKHKRQSPKKTYNFSADKAKGFDPHWMGRLLKRNLLLNNPGLLPPIDKAAISFGNEDKVKLIHPDFHVRNCPSDLYFPLTEKAKKAFCKINKTVQDKIGQHVHNYEVENPWLTKDLAWENVLMKSEEERKSILAQQPVSLSYEERHKTLQQWRSEKFTLEDVLSTSEEKMVYEYETKQGVPPVIKTMCVDYPGLNRQLYGRPVDTDEGNKVKAKRSEEKLRYRGLQIPSFPMNISEDVWQKLSKARQRQVQMEKNAQARSSLRDPDHGKFRTFTQLEMRNLVLEKARVEFMIKLKEDPNTPLPPELFEDNRDQFEPYHDFFEKGEFPPQGPYSWRISPEEPPTEEELEIVEKSINDSKLHHNFTHHLPGLLYHPRHPYPPFELDWMEKGLEEGVIREVRKTPSELYEFPAYVMHLDKTSFQETFDQEIGESAKELVGPEMWNLYKKMYGIVEDEPLTKNKTGSQEDLYGTVAPEKKLRRRKKKTPSIQMVPKLEVLNEEEEGEDIVGAEQTITKQETLQGEEEDIDEEEEEAEDETTGPIGDFVENIELELDEKLSAELLVEETLPLPSLRFSVIDFPTQEIPQPLKDDFKIFKSFMESSEPVRKDEEEPKGEDDAGSDTSTDEDSSDRKHPLPEPTVSHDPVSHLQVMYQDAVKSKQRSTHRPMKDNELEPPKLKDIFLRETFIEDIDNLLTHNENIPKFLQLF